MLLILILFQLGLLPPYVKHATTDDIREYDIIIDVRPHEERISEGFLPESRQIDLVSMLWSPKIPEEDQDKKILIMCRSGQRSRMAAQRMLLSGYKNVATLSGGITAVKSANLPHVSLNSYSKKEKVDLKVVLDEMREMLGEEAVRKLFEDVQVNKLSLQQIVAEKVFILIDKSRQDEGRRLIKRWLEICV